MRESYFQRNLIREIEDLFPGAIVIKVETRSVQGFPDLLILWHDKWATLECKAYRTARKQPNQEGYVRLLDEMSFSSFVYPENKEEVLHDLQQAFRSRRKARVSKS